MTNPMTVEQLYDTLSNLVTDDFHMVIDWNGMYFMVAPSHNEGTATFEVMWSNPFDKQSYGFHIPLGEVEVIVGSSIFGLKAKIYDRLSVFFLGLGEATQTWVNAVNTHPYAKLSK
jgi:hypothetical protein